MDEINSVKDHAISAMTKCVAFLETEFTKIRAGKASPNMLQGIDIDYYGNPTPIAQVATISILDSKTITIQPWEKKLIQPIERAIVAANLGITPQNDGVNIRLIQPALTEERRKEFVKRAFAEGEQAKVTIRTIRREAIETIKKSQKDGLSEDEAKDLEGFVQQQTNEFILLIDKHLLAKQKEIMAV